MIIGDRLIELREKMHLTKEEVAEKLKVKREEISSWEENKSTPDFNKIVPLCNLYNITINELFVDEDDLFEIVEDDEEVNYNIESRKNRIVGILMGILLYFLAITSCLMLISMLKMDVLISVAVAVLIAGIATCVIIYSVSSFKNNVKQQKKKKIIYDDSDELTKNEIKEQKMLAKIEKKRLKEEAKEQKRLEKEEKQDNEDQVDLEDSVNSEKEEKKFLKEQKKLEKKEYKEHLMMQKKEQKELKKQKKKEQNSVKASEISNVVIKETVNSTKTKHHVVKVLFFIIVISFYIFTSIKTSAWSVTWIIWIIYAVICKIGNLFGLLRGGINEK